MKRHRNNFSRAMKRVLYGGKRRIKDKLGSRRKQRNEDVEINVVSGEEWEYTSKNFTNHKQRTRTTTHLVPKT